MFKKLQEKRLRKAIRKFEQRLFYWTYWWHILDMHVTKRGLEFTILSACPGAYWSFRGGFKWKRNDETRQEREYKKGVT